MKFFGRLINMFNREDPFPKRQLRLQYPPSPQVMHLFAQQYVDVVRQNDRFQLDYSVASIKFVDAFLQRFRDAGITAHNFAETIFVAGAYVGQVMVQHAGGQWVSSQEAGPTVAGNMMTVVIKLPNDTYTDPISKAFKRFHNGKSDELQYFYQVMTDARS